MVTSIDDLFTEKDSVTIDDLFNTGPEVKAPEGSVTEDVLLALSKPGSLSREALFQIGEVMGGGDFKPSEFKKILAGEKEFSSNMLKNLIQESTGVNLTIPGEGFIPEAANIVADIGLDIVTDPLGFIALPGLFKASGKLLKAENAAQAGKASQALARKGLLPGATIGGLSANPDDDVTDVLEKIAVGAAAGPFIGLVAGESIPFVQKISNMTHDAYLSITRPETIRKAKELAESVGITDFSPSNLQKIVNSADSDPLTRAIADQAFNQKIDILEQLDKEIGGEGVRKFTELTDSAFEKTVMARKRFITALLKNPEHLRKGKNSDKILKSDIFNLSTERANTYVGNWVDTQLDGIADSSLRNSLKDAVGKFRSSNRTTIDRYNKARKGKSALKDYEHIDIEPIDHHTVDFIDDAALTKVMNQDIPKNVKAGFAKRERTTVNDLKKLMAEEDPLKVAITREAIGRQRVVSALGDQAEKAARSIMTKVTNAPVEAGIPGRNAFEGFENALKAYDGYTNYFKKMVLGLNHTWIKNNWTDNSIKAIVKHGLEGLDVSLTSGNPLARFDPKSTMSQLIEAGDPSQPLRRIKFDQPDMRVAESLGLIDNTFFKSVAEVGKEDLIEVIARKGTSEATRIMTQLESRSGGFKSAINAPIKHIEDYVLGWGSAMEGTYKLKSFELFKKGLLAGDTAVAKSANKAIKELGIEKALVQSEDARTILTKARDMVNDTFFDYSNLSTGEQAIVKRVFPFYTFFSRNFEFWGKEFANEFGSINAAAKFQNNTGKKATADQRNKFPDWVNKYGARISKQSAGGDVEALSLKNSSFIDFLGFLETDKTGERSSRAVNLMNPIPKLFYQALLGKDTFLGGEFRPSKRNNPNKLVFQPFPFGVTGQLHVDPETGTTTTSKDHIAALQEVFNAAIPATGIQNIVRKFLQTKDPGNKEMTIDRFAESVVSPFKRDIVTAKKGEQTKSSRLRRATKALKRKERAK